MKELINKLSPKKCYSLTFRKKKMYKSTFKRKNALRIRNDLLIMFFFATFAIDFTSKKTCGTKTFRELENNIRKR